VSEHLHNDVACKTVFATHYHELTQLARQLAAARNYNVAVREVGDEIVFLHRVTPGGADRSYGIEVGRLAGLPEPVIARARVVLRLLEGEGELLVPGLKPGGGGQASEASERIPELPLFDATEHPVVERLRQITPESTTPMDALRTLDELVKLAQATNP
jgi:DNA mismatch repair protein MutS